MKNKKKLIIVGLVLIIFIFVIILMLYSKENDTTSKVVCEIKSSSFYADLKTTHVVYYNDEDFEKLELEILMEVTDQLMIEKIDLLKEKYEESFDKMAELESFDYQVTKENNTLIIKNSVNAVDYKKMVEIGTSSNDEGLSTSIDFYDDQEKFINDIVLQGGTCSYE